MKNFILLWLVVLTGSLWAQASKTPEIVVPTIKGSDDYKATYYEEGRTYRAEEWLETYMQYYHSNTDTSLHLLTPSDLFAQLRGKAENQKAAQLYFDLRNTQVFNEATRPETVEAFLSEPEATRPMSARKYAQHLTSSQLLFAGMVFPNDIENPKAVPVVVEWSRPFMKFVNYIYISDRTGRRIASIGRYEGTSSFTISDYDASNCYWEIGLTTGKIYKFRYQYKDPTLGPPIKKMRPPYNPVSPPSPPVDPVLPIIPELDEDCNILPTYFNQPGTGLPYSASIVYPNPEPVRHLVVYEVIESIHLGNGEFKEIWGINEYYFDDLYTTTTNRGVHGEIGEIYTAVYLNPYHTKLTNPIIVTDGIDFLSNRDLNDIFKSFGGNNMISLLWDGGYDVIIADYAGGADFIQRNAFAFIELIRSLRQDQGVENIEAAIGPSMGGQIIRYALMYWENKLKNAYGSHNLKTFVSADSPWSGANASPAVQIFADKNLQSNLTSLTIHTSANSPAARQLLLNHTFGRIHEDIYYADQHEFKDKFDFELESLGNKPIEVKKIISIIDGSGNGESENVKPNQTFMELRFLTQNAPFFSDCIFISSLKGNSDNIDLIDREYRTLYGNGLSCYLAEDEFPLIRSIVPEREFDSTPGSPFNLEQYLTKFKPGEEFVGSFGFKLKLYDLHINAPFTFIPTFSALGMSTDNATSNFFTQAIPNGKGYIMPGSPFDAVYFDDKDSKHNDISGNQQPGSLPFLLEQINYSSIYHTQCLIMENVGIGTESVVFYQEQPVNQHFCVPFDIDEVTTVNSVNCGVELIANGTEIELSTNGDEEPCTTEIIYCMDITGCGQICKTVEITVSPGSSNRIGSKNLSTESLAADTYELNSKINIYPNPCSGPLNVDIYDENDFGIVTIYNALGRIVTALRTQNKMDLSFLTNGVYTLEFKNKSFQKIHQQKLIIVK
jgi:hypothetical protein